MFSKTSLILVLTNLNESWIFKYFADTRETGFVYSISAAGVVFAVTKACSRGSLLQCSCDNTVRDISSDGEWVWGGCHDDVNFGYVKSREFMDARRKKRRGDVTTKIQLHNNEAGRLVGIDVFKIILNKSQRNKTKINVKYLHLLLTFFTSFIHRWRSIDRATLLLSEAWDKHTSWLVNVTFDWRQVMTTTVQRMTEHVG